MIFRLRWQVFALLKLHQNYNNENFFEAWTYKDGENKEEEKNSNILEARKQMEKW